MCIRDSYTTGKQAMLNKPYHSISAITTVPTDITGGTAFNIPIVFNVIPRHAIAGGLTYFTIAGFASAGLRTSATSLTLGSTAVNVSLINDTLWIGPFPENVTSSGTVNLPKFPVSGSEDLKTIKTQFLFKYRNCAGSDFIKGGCLTNNFTCLLYTSRCV